MNKKQKDLMVVSDVWILLQGKDPNQFRFGGATERSVEKFLEALPVEEVISALEIADEKIGFIEEPHQAFKYFCGVCWGKIKDADGETIVKKL